jgi:hypothetical protein
MEMRATEASNIKIQTLNNKTDTNGVEVPDLDEVAQPQRSALTVRGTC